MDYLYKYRPIDKFLDEILLNSQAYFSSPDDFDDPFDCKINPYPADLPAEATSFLETFKSTFKEKGSSVSQELVDFFSNPELLKQAFFEDWQGRNPVMLKKARIFCLTELNDSIPMWSLYADSHRGICLQFQIIDDPFYHVLYPVVYGKSYPSFRLSQGDMPGYLFAQLTFKSIEWCYQKEWRIIKNVYFEDESLYDKKISRLCPFPSKILTGVIFGCRADEKQREHVLSILKQREFKVSLFNARPVDQRMALDIVQIGKS